MTFPKIYQRKISCVNDVSVMIAVSIATVYLEVYFDYFLSFFSFFFVFSLSFSLSFVGDIFYFCALVSTKYVFKNKIICFLMTPWSAV